MYNNPKYSIVIPTYNHLHDCLIPCLESIKQYTDLANIEVIVVANGCVDDTANYVNSLGYPFILIEEKEQLGYTKATNLGLKASKGEYIVLLNNDAQLLPQQKNYWLETMARPFEILERVGMTGPMLFKGIEGQSNDFVMFFCAMTTRKIIDEVGYLDEIYSPGGVEDVDYGLRLILADYKLLSVPLHEDVIQNPSMSTGSFPIFHPGGTTCSKEKGWNDILIRNNNILKQKFPDYFRGIDWIDSMEKKKQAEKKDFKVYDCFPFFNEIELLKIRLTELDSVVDKFIITEALYTHSGKPKPLYLQENIHLFDKYKDKIILHTVDFPANIQDPWHRERMQRDAAFDVLHNMLTEKDYVIISDCDEIPNVAAIHQYINDNVEKIGILQQKRFMYYFNNQNIDTDEPQSNSRIISGKMLKKHNFTPCAIRYCDKFNLCPYYNIDNGGWHFTFMGGAEKVIEKIKSFAHMEYDTEEKTNLDVVKNNMKISKDVYNCNSSWKFVDIDKTFPKLIQEQVKYYEEIGYVKSNIKFYDCFIFNDELDILEIRLNELDCKIDHFVLVEAKKTHTGHPKPLYFAENKKRYEKFLPKIIHLIVDDFPDINNDFQQASANELYQRNFINSAIQSLNDDDMLILSDVDEIVNPEKIKHYDDAYILSQKMYYFNFNTMSASKWLKAKIMPYKAYKRNFLSNFSYTLRDGDCPIIENGGWHLSYFGGLDAVCRKIKSFSHCDLVGRASRDYIKECIKNRVLIHNSEKLLINNNIEDVPNYCKQNKNRFSIMYATEPLMEKLKRIAPFTYDEIFVHNVNGMEQQDYKNATVIDIGANVGCFAIKAVELGSSRIHCFEPEIRNFSMLQDIVSDYNCIKTYNFAVVDENKKFVQMCSEGAGANIYGDGDDVSEYVTPCISLGKIIDMINTEDLIVKLDCEGSEFEILFNLDASYYKKIRLLIVEIHDTLNKNYLYKSEKLISHIRSFNFDIDFTGPRAGVWYSPTEWVPSPLVLHRFRRK